MFLHVQWVFKNLSLKINMSCLINARVLYKQKLNKT